MYSHHFGLTQDPFSIAPDPRYLFMSERHREALAHLLFGVAGPGGAAGGTGGGFVLLTGDIGTGKTTICRCFLEQIPGGCHVAYIFNPKLTVTELLQSICEEFHIEMANTSSMPATVKDYIDALNLFLLESHAAGQSSVLIIDEAQNLQPEVLEQLRLLTNLETSERKLLQIVLIGQPELRSMLDRPELEQLAQRVIARFHLSALTEAESTQYIGHRLAVAGLNGPLPFESRSLKRIHRLTHGVPRRINLLCGRAMLGAWANGLHRVDPKVVDKAAAEVFGTDNKGRSKAGRKTSAYLVAALVLLALAAAAVSLLWPAPQTRQAVAQGGGAAPLTPASAAPEIAAQPASTRKLEELEALLPRLPQDIDVAWRELAPDWKLQATQADPCLAAIAQQLQCYRTASLTVPLLRQLGQPGILTLQTDKGPALYAVLVGLADQSATLRMADGLHDVRLLSLASLWRGDFATYWRAPAGYAAELRDGNASAAIDHLARQLDLLDGAPARPAGSATQVLDPALRARVRAFQRAQGLKPDGQPGPLTFMQLDRATGVDGPRLQTEAP
ncbi:MAG: AAA family ATPase [Rhodoferax sp.]